MSPEIYHSQNYVVLDLETDTSGGTYGHAVKPENRIVLASYRLGPDHPQGPLHDTMSIWGGEYDLEDLVEAIEDADFLVAHSAKYELGWLHRAGLDLRTVTVFDTEIAEYVLMGNLAAGDKMMRYRSTSLDNCCKRRGWRVKDPVVDILMKGGVNPVNMPRPWLRGRCEQDVESTEELFKDQLVRLVNTNRLPVMQTRCILTPLLAAMELEGMALDAERVQEAYEDHIHRLAALTLEMNALAGEINWRSSKQLAEFVYGELGFEELKKRGQPIRTPTGAPKTDNATMAQLKATNKKQREFLRLRKEIGKVNAALTKNLEFFLGVCEEQGEVFHAEFKQTSTATHRLSSSGIKIPVQRFGGKEKTSQFQNLPGQFKRLFRAKRDGWKIVEIDGSQLEFRIAAELSRDPQALADIEAGHDVHRFTGAWIYHAPKEWLKDIAGHISDSEKLMPQVTKEERGNSKPHTFKPVYGGQSGTPREKAYYEAFQQRYHVLASTQAEWVDRVLTSPHKRLITPWGMRYYWPRARVSNTGYCNVTSSVYNYPVQALATAEIIPVAITRLWHLLREHGLEDKVTLVNTIHDSVICECHPDAVEELQELAIQAFTTDVYTYMSEVYGMGFVVPLGIGFTVGDRWGEGPERAWNVWSDNRRVEVE